MLDQVRDQRTILHFARLIASPKMKALVGPGDVPSRSEMMKTVEETFDTNKSRSFSLCKRMTRLPIRQTIKPKSAPQRDRRPNAAPTRFAWFPLPGFRQLEIAPMPAASLP